MSSRKFLFYDLLIRLEESYLGIKNRKGFCLARLIK